MAVSQFVGVSRLSKLFDENEASGAGWSSLAARRAHNPKVEGSNPSPATNWDDLSRWAWIKSVSCDSAGKT